MGTSAVVAGLEVAASVAFTFVPPMLLKTGFGEATMSFLFGIGKNGPVHSGRSRKYKYLLYYDHVHIF